MANNESPANSPRTYSPPHNLLWSTGPSRDELVGQYEEFCHSLRRAGAAPELVFDRIIGNLQDVFSEALTRERAKHAAAQEAWRRKKEALKSHRQGATGATKGAMDVQLNIPSPALVTAQVPASEIYLLFWFTTSYTTPQHGKPEKSTRIRATTTTTPVPYGICAGWPDMEHLARSFDHGSYDTRMDPLIISPTIPTTFTKVIRYRSAFDTPPKVIVWLTGLSAPAGAAVCVKAVANDITETEFTLQIRSSDGTHLASVGVAWAVWPEAGESDDEWSGTRSVVNVGSVSTAKTGDTRVPVFSGSGSLRGAAVMAALSEVDMVLVGGVWVQLVVKQAGWQMGAGPVGASVYSARVAYAFE